MVSLRNASIVASAATLGLVLSACGGNGGDDPLDGDGGGQGSEGATEITFAAVTFAEPERGEKLQELVARFNDEQDDVFVNPVSIPYDDFANTVFTQLGAGSGPDVIRFDMEDLYAAQEADLLLPIDDYVDTSAYDFYPADEYASIDGSRYGVTFEIANYALMYNRDLISDADVPEDFESFLNLVSSFEGEDEFGFAFRTSLNEASGMWYDLSNFVYGFGGRWTNDGGQPTVDSDEVIAGVQAFADVYNSGGIPLGTDSATYRTMMSEGQVAMEIDNGGVASQISSGMSDPDQFYAADLPFPEPYRAQILAYAAVNANTDHADAAGQFINWLLEPGNQEDLQNMLGAGNPATPVERPDDVVSEFPWFSVYDDFTEYGVPVAPAGLETDTPAFRQIVIEHVVEVLQNGADVEDEMHAAQTELIEEFAS